MTALVQRYGPHGSFWTENRRLPYLPIRRWQVWNEPTLTCCFWTTRPFTRTYIPLLRAAHDALKRADRGAAVVLAGFPNDSWHAVERIYRVRGARSLFDEVAVHPYTRTPSGVLKILALVRNVMRRYGDGAKPMLATEVGWPSSLGQTPVTFGLATTPAGQAARLGALLPELARQRGRLGLAGFYLYTWMGEEFRGAATFAFSGLLRFVPSKRKVEVKPAYNAFRSAALAMEGCRVKGSLATVCAVPR